MKCRPKGVNLCQLVVTLSIHCFASVDRLIGRPEMFAKYLLTPLLENCQTWYSECPFRVNVSYWFSGHMVKGQGQTAGL